jgi:hypothetical protein
MLRHRELFDESKHSVFGLLSCIWCQPSLTCSTARSSRPSFMRRRRYSGVLSVFTSEHGNRPRVSGSVLRHSHRSRSTHTRASEHSVHPLCKNGVRSFSQLALYGTAPVIGVSLPSLANKADKFPKFGNLPPIV